ncbi:leupaxin [Nilaparvata lugens]|uniref:leupaxin n=1 Tax=Nilaparvata lugens TaxID=108931 RepID=UPI00193E2904|nr:leupaxin [Nilaparvata lugens]XP_022185756.2 leupaxin [Nilaparvata lugens]XP_039292500.1 leupaxin [Nilaparvata lugens]
MRASKESQKPMMMRRKSPGRGDDSSTALAMKKKSGNNLKDSSANRASNANNPVATAKDVYTCNTCKQPIEGVVIEALGQTWHRDHFTCTDCKQPITANKFNVYEGKPYCEEDYAIRFLKKCASCKQPITDVVISALNQNWHRNHFLCNSCGIVLSNSGFFEKDNSPYCQLCYEKKFMPKCQECQQPIIDTALMALGEKWHQSCFKCQLCAKPITNSTFEVLHNRPMCSVCSSHNNN